MVRPNAVVLLAFMAMLLVPQTAQAQSDYTCFTYFTGVGCPHCAKVDSLVLTGLEEELGNIIIIEYEIYQQQVNAPLMTEYNEEYGSGYGIPMMILDKGSNIVGDTPIEQNSRQKLQENRGNPCPLLDSSVPFESLDFSSIPGRPKIWSDGRILIRTSDQNTANNVLRGLLTTDNIASYLETTRYSMTEPVKVALSGSEVEFEHAASFSGWLFQWNGEAPMDGGTQPINTTNQTGGPSGVAGEMTWAKIFSLAAVDAVNPCALAVLSLMLIAIITYNPKNRKNILLAGLAFTLSVYVLYMVYGLVIIKFFQFIQALTSIRLLLYQVLGVVAIVLGILNIRDFFSYKPGSIGTEMPMSLRPKVKKIINGITSPSGAFIVGAFVTVFLLPCTIGPYIIAGGILSAMELLQTLPMLLVYNLIFVTPMIAITLVVYGGITGVKDVSEWKDKNIRYLHLIAGTIIALLGAAMVLGLV
ncbi:MAG: hypothetical protein DRO99_01430 [Candidatus Aenigmatarchaeota archaeon]|nr:MAG: hypothetical protein DRO99_01430 [Candidatus Aenigmarchaeota archaeon]